ncbi:hypothetical protein BpHYR1_046327 [Brachionus plicatilis]|uniref:Uncharacterized protein n=1 Tax=Brachionus plicatilis TaxID=10195 RepID=A0A3M7QGL9_BRAPC|nr:hypothetical protein BpHYR1_046327 [Brachionus plicatilis]
MTWISSDRIKLILSCASRSGLVILKHVHIIVLLGSQLKHIFLVGTPVHPAAVIHGNFVHADHLGIKHDLSRPHAIATLVPHPQNVRSGPHGVVQISVLLQLIGPSARLSPKTARNSALVLDASIAGLLARKLLISPNIDQLILLVENMSVLDQVGHIAFIDHVIDGGQGQLYSVLDTVALGPVCLKRIVFDEPSAKASVEHAHFFHSHRLHYDCHSVGGHGVRIAVEYDHLDIVGQYSVAEKSFGQLLLGLSCAAAHQVLYFEMNCCGYVRLFIGVLRSDFEQKVVGYWLSVDYVAVVERSEDGVQGLWREQLVIEGLLEKEIACDV